MNVTEPLLAAGQGAWAASCSSRCGWSCEVSLDPAKPLPGCGAGCVGGIVLSLVWMVVLRFGAGVMAWLTIVAVNAAMISCTMLSYEKAGALP